MPVEFKILSHAGLLVQCAGKSLIFDPWLVRSAYWRSWWNYPPVSRDLVDSLRPDFIYLTHIHWDHFHGPSLRKFPRETPILIPKGPARRMLKDLNEMGFGNVTEIPHGRSVELAPGFRLTSYHFYPFTDSAAVVECEDVTLFNANDAKLIYAVPFASNHCYLHRETFHLNDTVITPLQVQNFCRVYESGHPEVKAMVSGDGWSSESGFAIAKGPWFTDRDRCLAAYAAGQAPALEKSYAMEARTELSLPEVAGYFGSFIRSLPYPVRLLFKGRPVTYVLTGKGVTRFWVDIHRGVVREIAAVDDAAHPLQIHASAYVFRRCMAQGLFIHLGISKRVLFRSTRANARFLWLLISLFDLYECEMLPVRRMLSPRFLARWAPRWRELGLYAMIHFRMALGKRFAMQDYLKFPGLSQEGSNADGAMRAVLSEWLPSAEPEAAPGFMCPVDRGEPSGESGRKRASVREG